jgi:hypothetical protein
MTLAAYIKNQRMGTLLIRKSSMVHVHLINTYLILPSLGELSSADNPSIHRMSRINGKYGDERYSLPCRRLLFSPASPDGATKRKKSATLRSDFHGVYVNRWFAVRYWKHIFRVQPVSIRFYSLFRSPIFVFATIILQRLTRESIPQ